MADATKSRYLTAVAHADLDDTTFVFTEADDGVRKTPTTDFIDKIYPVGSIYMSVNSTPPSTLFGGTWEQIKDKFLLSAGNTYSAGSTGGEATHTLTTNEMPSHTHSTSKNLMNAMGSGTMIKTPSGSNYNTAYNYAYDTTATGGGAAHNNMPPYLVVYMWKRTA